MTVEPTPAGDRVEAPSCYRHPDREAYVRCTRCERIICPDCMRPAAVGFQCPDCVRAGSRSVRPARTAFGGRVGGDPHLITKLLVGLNVAVYLLVALRYPPALLNPVITPAHVRFGLLPAGLNDHEYYRLLTSMFLHYGPLHLGLNMFALWLIGRELEAVLGRARLVALYLVSGLGGGTLVWLVPQGGVTAGASGAIFGLFAGYFIVLRRLGMQTGGVVAIIVINLALGLVVPNISWLGHVGGLATGAAVAAVLAYAPRGRSRIAVQGGGVAAVLLLLVALLFTLG